MSFLTVVSILAITVFITIITLLIWTHYKLSLERKYQK